jgi:hypothetical protein
MMKTSSKYQWWNWVNKRWPIIPPAWTSMNIVEYVE